MVAFFANYGVVGTAADRVFAAKLRVGNCTRCALRRDVRIGIHCQAQTMVVDGYDIRSDGSNHYLLWCTGHYGWTAAPAPVFRCVFWDDAGARVDWHVRVSIDAISASSVNANCVHDSAIFAMVF